MNKQIVRLGLSFSALGYVAFVAASGSFVACSSKSSDNPGSSSQTNTNSDGGGSSTGGGTSGVAATATCDPGADLIDDMLNQQTDGVGTAGYWYTYSDRTNPVSEPPVVEDLPDGAVPPGSIVPAEGASFGFNATGPGTITNAREVTGGGENNWGAGFGFDLFDALPDGGMVPFDACEGGLQLFDTSPDAGSTGIPQSFDASSHKGVTFWAKANTAAALKVNVQFSEKRTSPWGGVCDPCLTSGKTACSDDYLVAELFGTDWKQYTIHWTDLNTQNWTMAGLPKKGFDPSTWYYMHFQFSTNSGVALGNFDLSVACIEFVDN